jgi:hypothetical protein
MNETDFRRAGVVLSQQKLAQAISGCNPKV